MRAARTSTGELTGLTVERVVDGLDGKLVILFTDGSFVALGVCWADGPAAAEVVELEANPFRRDEAQEYLEAGIYTAEDFAAWEARAKAREQGRELERLARERREYEWLKAKFEGGDPT